MLITNTAVVEHAPAACTSSAACPCAGAALGRAGVHPEIVSERLGHAKVSITLDVYSHAVPTLQREAAGKLAALVYGASS